MAAPLLFDLSEIDASATVMSVEQILRINPQTGHMRQLDRLVWLDEKMSRGVGVKHVGDDEFWVPGHIPGRPLLPGVLMIEAAAQLCSLMHKLKEEEDRFIGFTRCQDVVFRGQVVPGDDLLLLAKEVSRRPRRFVSATQGVVDGELVFEAQITGMVM